MSKKNLLLFITPSFIIVKAIFIGTVLLLFSCSGAGAEIIEKDVKYKEGKTALEGFLVYDDTIKDKLPGVLVIHEWNGLGSYVKERARQLAKLGYAAFCADVYGKGIRPKNNNESAIQSGIYRKDRKLMRKRVLAGLEELKKQKMVDSLRTAAIGYCFGGGAVLELARSGAEVSGIVSFHGNLDTPDLQDAKNIRAKVLVLHGADDPHIPNDKLLEFIKEMKDAGVDWQINMYGGAVHSFTNPDSGNNPASGAAYDKQADERSWEAMKSFFSEIFKY